MTRTIEGVRDPIQVSPEHENIVVGGALVPDGFGDTIYEVDNEGFARDENGDLVHHCTRILATDVDPETWGEHYHNPADCPEKELPTHRPFKTTCDGCTLAEDKEHERTYYIPNETSDKDPGEVEKELRAIVDSMEPIQNTSIIVSKDMQEQLQSDLNE